MPEKTTPSGTSTRDQAGSPRSHAPGPGAMHGAKTHTGSGPSTAEDAPPIARYRIEQADVPDVYRRVARIYDAWAWLTESRARKLCLERAAVRDGEHILEVAVGTGLVFRELVTANPSGVTDGIDLTDAMLERARAKVARLPGRHSLAVGDAHHIDAPDGTYDLVVNNFMFDLLPEEDFAPILAEFRRVLKPGGRLVLVNMARSERPWNRIWEVVYRVRPTWVGGCRGVALLPHVEAAGFTGTSRVFVSQSTFPSEVLAATRPR